MQINGQMLRQLRQAKRLSQEQLGDAVGLTRVWIGMIEREEKEPGLDTLDRLVTVLGRRGVEKLIVTVKDRATFNGKSFTG